MSSCKIHNVRFYDLEPRAVTCLSYEPNTKKLALSRNDKSIEIWNVENTPFIESTIAGQIENSIEAIIWIDNRLFSTGLHGNIIEYNLKTLQEKYKCYVTGGAAWCMDVNKQKTRLAVGTEDGYINTFIVDKNNLVYERIFDKQIGRILCIKWDNKGEMIFTGSVDTVRVWNVASGLAVHKMTTSRKFAKKKTIVWCLAVTDDNIIVSGDSRGVLSFWDPYIGTQIEEHESHTADILAVTLSHDTNTIYCAGVDPIVRSFSKIIQKSSGRLQWVKNIERRLHDHDVRALVEADGKLFSAGVDGYLAQSSYPPKILVKYPPLIQSPSVIVCQKSRCILLRYTTYIELWRLGSSTQVPSELSTHIGMLYELDEKPIRLFRLKTKNEEQIISCAINKDSKTVVYSTDNHVRVFNFDVIEGNAQLSRNDSPISDNRIQKMLFSPNGKLFVTANAEDNKNIIKLYKVKKTNLIYKGSFETEEQFTTSIGQMCFSPDNNYLICSDKKSSIAIFKIDGDLSECNPDVWYLPKYRSPPTAMAVQNNTLNLVVVYSDHKIIEYNILKKQYTEFSNNLQSRLPMQWLARPFPITNITFDSNNEDVIIMHDDSTVYVINKSIENMEKQAKLTKRENGYTTEDSSSISSVQSQHTIQIAKKYKHLVYLSWVNDTEMIAVEVNPLSLAEKLPPSLKQKWFGM